MTTLNRTRGEDRAGRQKVKSGRENPRFPLVLGTTNRMHVLSSWKLPRRRDKMWFQPTDIRLLTVEDFLPSCRILSPSCCLTRSLCGRDLCVKRGVQKFTPTEKNQSITPATPCKATGKRKNGAGVLDSCVHISGIFPTKT